MDEKRAKGLFPLWWEVVHVYKAKKQLFLVEVNEEAKVTYEEEFDLI